MAYYLNCQTYIDRDLGVASIDMVTLEVIPSGGHGILTALLFIG